LKALTPQGEVAKLFSKHFKVGWPFPCPCWLSSGTLPQLPEHITYCEKTAFSLAAGTPDRLVKLASAGALSLDSLQHLILDVTHLDAKNKSVLDQKEVRDVLLRDLLGHPTIKAKLEADRMKLVFY
jgi:protein CMS1